MDKNLIIEYVVSETWLANEMESVAKAIRLRYPDYTVKCNHQTKQLRITRNSDSRRNIELTDFAQFAKGALLMLRVMKMELSQFFG